MQKVFKLPCDLIIAFAITQIFNRLSTINISFALADFC